MSNKGLPSKGFKQLWYWIMEDDVNESYGFAKESPANVNINVEVTNTEGDWSANDKVMITDSEFAYATVTVELGNETKEMEADLHGHTIDGKGNLVCNVNDKAPYVALAYEVPLGGGISAYRLLPKVKFGVGGESAATKTSGNITYGTKSITGKAIANNNGDWCVKGETGDTNIANWFKTPQIPNAKSVNKGILNLAIAKAKSIDTSTYTEATVQALAAAITTAEATYADAGANDKKVTQDTAGLLDAIVGLATA